jgi:hypothetical protein
MKLSALSLQLAAQMALSLEPTAESCQLKAKG